MLDKNINENDFHTCETFKKRPKQKIEKTDAGQPAAYLNKKNTTISI